jgi:hypothetical protein
MQALKALTIALPFMCGCAAPPPPASPAPVVVTLCGTVEVVDGDESGAAPALVLRDARSGTRFVLQLPETVRVELARENGGTVESVLDGASVCATGDLRDDRILEVSTRASLTVHPQGG